MHVVLTYALGAVLGLVTYSLAIDYFTIDTLAKAYGSTGAIFAILVAFSQRVETKLGEIESIQISDDRIRNRLFDRIAARRRRLLYKRIFVFLFGLMSSVPYMFTFAERVHPSAKILVGSFGAAAQGACLLGLIQIFAEANSLEARKSEIIKLQCSLSKSADEGNKRKKAVQESRSNEEQES